MQDNRPMNNDEIEIDLVELFAELKKKCRLIAGTTVAFAAAAAIYSFCIAKPVYQYDVLIRIPAIGKNHMYVINTCIEILKNDVVATVSNPRGTSLLKLSFSANSPNMAKQNADQYIPLAVKKVNTIIQDSDVANLEQVVSAVSYNSTVMNSYKAEVILLEKNLDTPVSPNKKKNIGIATVFGCILSACYVIGKYIFNKK